jgi:DNA-binding CsgD family transcriptional regulator
VQAGSAADRVSLYRPVFVGREAELQRLQSAYEDAVQGRPALVALAGEPGIGKTALCTQLAKYVSSRGGRVLWGHCAETEALSLAYLPIVQALEEYTSSMDTLELRDDLGSSASALARIVPQLRQRLCVDVEPASDPDEDRWRLFQAVITMLRSGAARQPIVLMLEDLHEADRGTLDLLTHFARHIGDARLLVLGTYRDVEVDRTHPLASTLAELRRFPHFARLGLHGLSIAEVHRFYCEVRGQDVSLSRAQTVHQQTEGNPLFVQEVLRYLVEAGLVVQRDGAYVPKDVSLIEAEVPEGLRDIVGKRLNHLSEPTNEVLHIAAVIGHEFRLDVLQRVCGLDEEVLFEALEEAQARALIDEAGGFGTSVRFRFTHAFFRQTLYDEIFAARRIRWHRLIGSVLEQVYSDRLDEHAGELAVHFAHSSDPADLARAIAFDERAAEQAVQVYAYGEAARHLERALLVESALDTREPLKRCDLLLAMGEAMLAMEQSPRRVVGTAREAFQLAETHADERRAARAAGQVVDALSRPWPSGLEDTAEAHEWVGRLDRLAAPESTERVYADIWVGVLAVASGRPAENAAPMLRAVDLARRLGDDVAYGAAAAFALPTVAALSHVDVALRLAAEFMAHPHSRMRAAHLALGLSAAGRLFLGAGDRDGADRAWDELDHLAAQSHESTARLLALPINAVRALMDGDLETAALHVEVDSKFVESIGLQRTTPYNRFVGIRALYYLGRANDSLLTEFPGERRTWVAFRAIVRALLGRCDEALALRARFAGIERPDDATSLVLLTFLLEVSIHCRDTPTAEALLNRMAPLAHRLDGASLVSCGRLLGNAALLLGRPVQAREAYEQALAVCEKVRFRPELALVRLDLAELILSSYPSEHARAVDHLRIATAEFEAMHMRPSLERAVEISGRAATALESRSATRTDTTLPESLEPLTEREREVATLLAKGMSNREIAATLVISESTAEVHVKHILSKLGLRSRSQVAAWAAQRDLHI